MYMVKINNNYYEMLDTYSIENSSSEVKYSNIKIDFENGTFFDLPLQYQEVVILNGTEKEIKSGKGDIKYFGYVESYELSSIKNKTDDKELTISLLSPMKLATLRTINVSGEYDLNTLLDLVLEPLIEEGFKIKIKEIKNANMTVQFIMQTVEYCMNYISNSKNIFWYINELKEIYIYDIKYIMSKNPKLKIDEKSKIEGFIDIKPNLTSVDYANVLNLKKARIFFSTNNGTYVDDTRKTNFVLAESPKYFKNGDTITFNFPVAIDESTLKMLSNEQSLYKTSNLNNKYGIHIEISLLNLYNDDGAELELSDLIRTASIYWDADNNKYVMTDNIMFSDEGTSNNEEKEFVLQRDSFFKNLITGVKWNNKMNKDGGGLTKIYSDSALKYTTAKIFFDEEIQKCKGIINKTGKIEKTIDMNGRWFTQKELIEYAKTLMVQISNTCNEIELVFDVDQNLKLGDLVNINMPNFFVVGNFIVTSILEEKTNFINQYTYKLRNTNLLENFIDFFRANQSQEGTSEVDDVIIGTYSEEKIKQSYIVEEVQNEDIE